MRIIQFLTKPGDAHGKRGVGVVQRDGAVRRLKGEGLTESLGMGYRLSPRGRALLAALGDAMPGRPDLVLSGVNRGNNAGENVL